MREADTALQMLNRFDMGHGVQLVVKISESQTARQQRLAKKREEEAFLNTLHCAKYSSKPYSSEGEDFEMSEKEASKGLQNPFVPRYTPHSGSGSDSPVPAVADSSPTPTSLSSSAGAASLRGQSGARITEASDDFDPNLPSTGSQTGKTSLTASQGSCTVCGKPCTSRCARCKAPYCSTECQQQDWARHKAECQPPGSTGSGSPRKEDVESSEKDSRSFQTNGPLKIAETIDDEGFHISTLDDSELDELQDFIQQAAAPPVTLPTAPPTTLPLAPPPTRGSGSTGMEGKPDFPGSQTEAAYTSVVSQEASSPAKQEQSIASSPTKHVQFVEREVLPDHEEASDNASRYASPEVVIPLSEIMPHFESPTYPLASIPIGAPLPRQFNAVVTSILGATKFSVIPLSVEAKQVLVKLQRFAREASLGHVNPHELTIGSKCGLYLNEEGFCRVEVTDLSSRGKVVVKRWDLGGQLFIPSDMLSRLPEEILELPCLRKRCSLVNLWNNDELVGGAEFLFSQVQGSPVSVQNCGAVALRHRPDIKIVLCKLESADGSVDISKAVESSQFSKPQKLTQAQPSSPQSAGKPGKPVVLSPKRGPPLTKPPAGPHSQYKMVHFANKVPFHCPPRGRSFKIHPMTVVNPSVIWAHVVHDKIGILYRMQDDLNKEYQKSKNDSYSPTVGEICAAKFSNDQKFYRAEVLCVNHDGTVDIHYVDFGNRETIMVGQLRHLAPIFLSLPKQALQFTLAGIKPVGSSWSDGAIACLKEKVMTKKILVEIVSDAPKTFFVKLFDPDSPQKTFNDELVSLGYAVHADSSAKSPKDLPSPLRGVSISHGNVSPSATSPYRNSPPAGRHVLLPTPPRVMPDSPHDSSWKLQPREKPATSQEGGVPSSAPQQLLEPHTPPLSPQPHPDTPTDGSSISRKAPEEKATPNNQPSLLGSPPKMNSNLLAQQPRMQDFTQGKPLSPHSLDLQSPTNQRTPRKSGGLAPWRAEPQGLEKAGQREEPAPHRLMTPGDFEKPKIKNCQMLAEGRAERALVSHVDNPYQFWVQVVDEKSLGTLLEFTQKLNQAPLKQSSPRAGDNCVCRYSQDGCLYRGRVNSITDSSATVQFIDYGNTEDVSPSDLFEVEPEFLTLPAQAVLCTLNQLLNPRGKGEAWDPAAVSFFRSQISDDKVVTITVVKALGLKHVVDVTVSGDSGGKSLLELMVESGHGMTASPKSPSRGRGQQRSPGAFAGSREKQVGTVGGSSEPSRAAPWRGRPGQGGTDAGQRAPRPGQGGTDAGQRAPRPGQGGTESGQRTSRPGQGGTESGQRTSIPGQGGTESGQRASRPGQGGTESGQRTSRPGQGGTESGQRAPRPGHGGMESGRQAPWKGKTRQGGPSLQPSQQSQSPSQSAAPPLNQGPTPGHSALPNKVGSPSQPKPSPFSRLRSPQGNQDPAHFSATTPTQTPRLPKVTSLTVISPPTESDYFEALASEVLSPVSLFLQVASRSSAQALSELSTGLTSLLQTHPPAPLTQTPDKGSLCCSKFSQDGMWYRAEIIETFPGGCVVRFIDFGNTDSVQLHDLAPCPSQFCNTPIMAIQCALKGVSPARAPQTSLSSGQTRWSMEAIAFLKQKCSDRILLAKVAGRSPELGLPLVELVDTSSDKDVSLAEELINAGLATAETAANAADRVPSASSMKQPPVQSPPKLPLDPSPPKLVQSSPNALRSSALSIAPVRLPEDVLFKVQVTDSVDPSCFSVQQIAEGHLSAFMDLMNQLQLVYCDPVQYGGFQPAVGAVCCTRYQVDDCWYRCRVVELSGDRAKLCYLDFGNTEVVSQDQIYHLDPKFTTLPSYAVQCSLSGVKPVSGTSWTGEAVKKFTNLLNGAEKTLMARVPPGETENSPVPLELYLDESCTRSVATALLESGHAKAANTPSHQHNQEPASSALVGVTPLAIPPFVLPADPEFRALITHANSLTEFFLQVVTPDIVKTVVGVWENMNQHCSTARGFSQPPSPGDLCLAKYDQEWFRARVLRQTAQDGFEVFFVDYGNKETVSLSLMKPMLEEFLSLPVQVAKCGLYGVPAGEVTHLSSSTLAAFSGLTANTTLTCRVVCLYPLLVELQDASGAALSVRDEMAKLHLFPPTEDLNLLDLPTNKLPTGSTSVVVVTEVVSPGEFWVQVAEVSTGMELDKMSRRMLEYCQSSPSFSQPPVLGQICCAKFSEDGSWYRARVIHVPGKGSLRVHFLDYGNQEVLPLSELCPFKEEFQYLPAQAIRCCLVGYEGGGVEGVELVRKFRGLVGNRQLVAVPKGMESVGVASVELVDTSTAEDVYIHKELK